MDVTKPVCCTEDQVEILNASFKQIDSVFGENVPVCAMNLKKLWCKYTCDPHQADYVRGLGHATKMLDNQMQTLSEVRYYVDS